MKKETKTNKCYCPQ